MENLLTDRKFWTNYWESKKDLVFTIKPDYLFHKQLANAVATNNIHSAIELGGFPGYYAVFLKKYLKLDTTLLDYFVHKPIVNQLLTGNGLQENDINIIEADLFSFQTPQQYDMVLSCGLIEHFNDTKDIIVRHLAFLKPGGTLFITLPNFHAVNGWVQKKFDKANFDKHNLNCMDKDFLHSICEELQLTAIEANYFGGFSVWLENKAEKSIFVKAFVKTIWFAGKVISKISGTESKSMSPYIMLQAKKPLA